MSARPGFPKFGPVARVSDSDSTLVCTMRGDNLELRARHEDPALERALIEQARLAVNQHGALVDALEQVLACFTNAAGVLFVQPDVAARALAVLMRAREADHKARGGRS